LFSTRIESIFNVWAVAALTIGLLATGKTTSRVALLAAGCLVVADVDSGDAAGVVSDVAFPIVSLATIRVDSVPTGGEAVEAEASVGAGLGVDLGVEEHAPRSRPAMLSPLMIVALRDVAMNDVFMMKLLQ
jgi:hypothetical protein